MEVSSFPDDFRCPISLEVMSDPVILASGHTFDRASIQRWLDSGNLTCPVTNLPLPRHPSLIPNHALRRLISQFAPPPPPPPPPLSFPSDPETLADLLRTIRTSSPDHRRTIADSQIPSVLFRHVSSRGEDHLRKLAIYCLLYLSLDDDNIKVGLVAEGGVDHLIEAVESRSDGSAAAATVVTSLSTVDVNKCVIGAHPSAIPSLAAMLSAEGSSKREKKEAATAIYELSKFPENRKRVVRTGAVGELARMAGSGSDRAAEVLALLAKTKEGRAEMGRIEGFVRLLVTVVGSGSRRGTESAMAALQLLSHEDGEIGAEAKTAAELVVSYGLAKPLCNRVCEPYLLINLYSSLKDSTTKVEKHASKLLDSFGSSENKPYLLVKLLKYSNMIIEQSFNRSEGRLKIVARRLPLLKGRFYRRRNQ